MNRHLSYLVAALGFLTACDNTVDPFVASEADTFAIYGYLDSEADTQFVRISPVIDASGFEYDDTLDVRVNLVNLNQGSELTLRSGSAPLAEGRRAYFYYTTEPPAVGAEYRLDVFRPGSDTTHAHTRMPGTDQVEIQDVETLDSGRIVQRIQWLDVGNVRDIRLNYHVRVRSNSAVVTLNYRSPQFSENNVTLVDLQQDRERVFAQLPSFSNVVVLQGISVTAELLSPEWGFGVEPGRIFFGSIGRVQKSWTLPDSIVTRLGYAAP